VLIGREAVRERLSEEFFGPEGPLTPAHCEEEAARWATFNDDDHWAFSHGERFEWSEKGEDYAIAVMRITAPLPFEAEVARLDALINNPHTNDFIEAVRTEAAHQLERWGIDHDAGKTDEDWFWLIGYLAGKALHTPIRKDLADPPDVEHRQATQDGEINLSVEALREKQLHRIITVAAAALNWHAAVSQTDNRMRPGIETPIV
jgi:hypothetical protein